MPKCHVDSKYVQPLWVEAFVALFVELIDRDLTFPDLSWPYLQQFDRGDAAFLLMDTIYSV